jgi:transposase
MREDAPQRIYSLHKVHSAIRYIVRAGCPWRMLPNDLPPWAAVHQQAMRWFSVGCFQIMAHDLRTVLPIAAGRDAPLPSAIFTDGRTLQSAPESGQRAGYDGHKRRKRSKTHIAVDTLVICCLCVRLPPTTKIALPPAPSRPRHEKPTARPWNWPTLIKALQENPPRRRRDTASNCVSSRWPKPSVISFYCRDGGSSREPLPGPHAAVAWHTTMDASALPWQECTGLPSAS